MRYLPKWAWALICLAQTRKGIVYLCVGWVGRAQVSLAQPGTAAIAHKAGLRALRSMTGDY